MVTRGARDVRDGRRPLPERFRRHADALVRGGRSPLYVALLRGAADDLERDGTVARLFADVAVPPGSVPTLRLMAALHHLVLSGRTPALSEYYPSVGGARPPEDAWPVARTALEDHPVWVADRLARTVQTNDPGRAVVLYAALLWLAERHGLSVRLLELGASAGLNLLADRFCYVVAGAELGDSSSSVRFLEPWERPPDVELTAAAARLRVVERAGCDLAPLDAGDPEDRITLLSYIWPDEPERLARTRAAMDVAAEHPRLVTRAGASDWLRAALSAPRPDVLTVVWHSLFAQYLSTEEAEALDTAYAGRPPGGGPVVWLAMEPGDDHLANVALTVRESPDGPERRLASCNDHGAPVRWC